ncbi:hypothetical protein DICA3_F35168 [Diutina catenulata]
MKSFAIAAYIAAALAGQSFYVITSHSGSVNVHLQGFKVDSQGVLNLRDGQEVALVLNSDGQLVDTKSDAYLVAGEAGKIVTSQQPGSGKWTIKDEHYLYYNDASLFGCPVGPTFAVFTTNGAEQCEAFSATVRDLKEVPDAKVGGGNGTTPEVPGPGHNQTTVTIIDCHVCEGGKTTVTIPKPTDGKPGPEPTKAPETKPPTPTITAIETNAGMKAGFAAGAAALAGAALLM